MGAGRELAHPFTVAIWRLSKMNKNSNKLGLAKMVVGRTPDGHAAGDLSTAKQPQNVMQLRRQALNELSDLKQTVQRWEMFYLVPERKLTQEEWQEFQRASELKAMLVTLSLRYDDGYITNNVKPR